MYHFLPSDEVIKTYTVFQVTAYMYFCGNTTSALGIFSQLCQESLMFSFLLFFMIHSNSLLGDNFSWAFHFSACLSSDELTALCSGCFSRMFIYWTAFEDRDNISFWGKRRAYLEPIIKSLIPLSSEFLSYNVIVYAGVIWSFYITL